jgi:DNA-binding SARP family transcriptional activator
VLDGFDQVQADRRLAAFLTRLAEVDPARLQVIVRSRVLDQDFWASFLIQGRARVWGEDSALPDSVLTLERCHKRQLEVYAFRGGAVYVNGRPVTDFEGPLVRGLFYYLIDHPLVTRDEIFGIFWPVLSVKEATNVFHVTKRKITECLGVELTEFRVGFYNHSPGYDLHYDVSAFERALPETEAAYLDAIRLHRGPFLYPFTAPWIAARREELHGRYVETLLGLARLYQAAGRADLAIAYFGRARQQAPIREDIVRSLMELHAAVGQVTSATQVFEQFTRILREQLHIQPSDQTRRVYEAILPKP